jgi:hypothetical protein
LAVGSEPVKDIINLQISGWNLKIISPTECVKDRLAGFYFWDDLQCLNQAVIVAQRNKIDIEEVGRWSKVENSIEKFEIFLKSLNEKK